MKILGIDPGTRLLGFALIEALPTQFKVVEMGVYKLSADQAINQRLVQVGSAIQELILTHKPNEISLEKIFLGKNADSAFKLGHARGVVVYHCLKNNVPLFEYATRVVKKGIVGRGSADKLEVKAVLEALLNLDKISSLDASDALALAVFHGYQNRKNLKLNNTFQNKQFDKKLKKSEVGLL